MAVNVTEKESGPIPPAGVRIGTSVNLFQGVSATPAGGIGPDSFSVTFTAISEGTTVIDLGALADYSDAYGVEGGADNSQLGDTQLSITVVPEPASIAASLAALASVLGVVSIRRRR